MMNHCREPNGFPINLLVSVVNAVNMFATGGKNGVKRVQASDLTVGDRIIQLCAKIVALS